MNKKYKCTTCNGMGIIKKNTNIRINLPIGEVQLPGTSVILYINKPGKVAQPKECPVCNGTGYIS